MSTSPTPGYTTRQVARLLDLSEGQVRRYVRAGFLEPRRGSGRKYRFSFQDLVILRVAKELVEARIPPQQVSRSLARLRRQLPRGKPLTAVRIAAQGERVVVREGDEVWEPESGQLRLDFEVRELVEKVAPLVDRRAAAAERGDAPMEAEDWFELACELEESRPRQAREAYRRTLELNPNHRDAHLNLGRLLHEGIEGQRDLPGAEIHYRRTLELDPTDGLAAFNLGVVLQDRGDRQAAVAAYQRAVEMDPTLADAYFNLAGLYEGLGQKALAFSTLKTYKDLTGR